MSATSLPSDAFPPRSRFRSLRAAVPLPDLLLTLPFLILFLINLAHHAMWRDELNAFGLAVASPTLGSLFAHIHYEGHPWLWYFVLWLASKISAYPVAMRIVEGVIGTAIYLLIGVQSPFSRLEKVLLFLCYFISFEYSVMSRTYALVLLLLLLYLRRRTKKPIGVVGNVILLGLIASTDLMGIILAGGLTLEYAYSLWAKRNSPHQPVARTMLVAVAIYGSLLIFAEMSLRLAPDISWRTTGHLFGETGSFHRLVTTAFSYLVLPYFPASFDPGHFWNPFFYKHRIFYAIWLPLILGTYYWMCRRQRNLQLLLFPTLFAALALGSIIHQGAMRHYGVTFLAFLAVIWLIRADGERLPWAAILLLCLTAIGGLRAQVMEWTHPFSNAQNAAGWITANQLTNATLIGTPDTSTSGVAEELHRPIYMLDCRCTDTFLLFSNRRDHFSEADVAPRIVEELRRHPPGPDIFIGVRPLNAEEGAALNQAGIAPIPLASFAGAENDDENFYLYRMAEAQAPAAQ